MFDASPTTALSPRFLPAAVYKAALFTAAFAVAGVASIVLLHRPAELVWPCAVLYALILLNTFFSVRIFSSVQPRNAWQNAADLGITVLYAAAAWSIGDVLPFLLAVTLMFAVATVKYALMLGKIPHTLLLREKILVDTAGTAAGLVALLLCLLLGPQTGMWIWAAGFAVVQLKIFGPNPLYAFRAGDR